MFNFKMPSGVKEIVQKVKLTLVTDNRLPIQAPAPDASGLINQKITFDENGRLKDVTYETIPQETS